MTSSATSAFSLSGVFSVWKSFLSNTLNETTARRAEMFESDEKKMAKIFRMKDHNEFNRSLTLEERLSMVELLCYTEEGILVEHLCSNYLMLLTKLLEGPFPEGSEERLQNSCILMLEELIFAGCSSITIRVFPCQE
jgi:hypothetical protein